MRSAVAAEIDGKNEITGVGQLDCLVLPAPLVEPHTVGEHDAAVSAAIEIREHHSAVGGGE